MTNFEKIREKMTPEMLVELEDEMMDCQRCYCREECDEQQDLSCKETRLRWLQGEV